MAKDIQNITAEDILNLYQGQAEFVRLWVMDAPIEEVQKALTLSASKDTPGTNRAVLEGMTLRFSLDAAKSARHSTRVAEASNRLAFVMVVIGMIQIGGLAYQVFRDYRVDRRNVEVAPLNVPIETGNLEDKHESVAPQGGGSSLKGNVDPIPPGEAGQQQEPDPENSSKNNPEKPQPNKAE